MALRSLPKRVATRYIGAMTDATNPKILIGASIPRSGHHFLANMMTSYFGPDLYYCETYTPANCCRQVPCTQRGAFRYIYQKSHDRQFKVPADIAEALYLVQYRHPVAEALSDRELDLKDMPGRPSLSWRRTRESYMMWLAAKAAYYRKFHDKWMVQRPQNAVYLDYVDLAGCPDDMMREIIEKSGAELDEARLTRTVEDNGGVVGGTRKKRVPFTPRVNTDSPHYDAELLGVLEDFILKRCPAYGFSRELEGSYEESALYGLILLRDLDEPLPKGETKRFPVAARLAPDHPEILRRLALRALREGRAVPAIKRLEKLLVQHPYFGDAYAVLFKACAEAGRPVPESVLTGNALVACAENAELSIALGAAFEAHGQQVNAMAAFAIASAMDPTNDVARERLAEARK
jgi:tetratricopeptide (TPR) repeat protein